MNKRFIYDEKTSSLYAPDGTLLKQVFCPKAKRWNQLQVEEGEERWRGCQVCGEKVIDLDQVNYEQAHELFKNDWDKTCVHASTQSEHVIFLKEKDSIEQPKKDYSVPVVIQTVRSINDIERGIAMGYWPDVRFIEPDLDITTKLTVGQNPETGALEYSGDYRSGFRRGASDGESLSARDSSEFEEVIPFTRYYPYHQQSPIAAYLIPKGLKGRTPVIVADPIEDIVGWRWNQGDSQRATNVPGYVEFNRVVLEPRAVEVCEVMG